MWRYPDGTFCQNAPARVECDGYVHKFGDLTTAERDGIGYNEAIPLVREPYTTYETEWTKGDDLIYRETVVSAVVDEAAKMTADISAIEKKYAAQFAELDASLINALWADGTAEASTRVSLSSKRATLTAEKTAEIAALFAV